jgi:hypothetical protein
LLPPCTLSPEKIFATRILGWKGGERNWEKGRKEEWEGVSEHVGVGSTGARKNKLTSKQTTEKGSMGEQRSTLEEGSRRDGVSKQTS